jgi:hypothetical protein
MPSLAVNLILPGPFPLAEYKLPAELPAGYYCQSPDASPLCHKISRPRFAFFRRQSARCARNNKEK